MPGVVLVDLLAINAVVIGKVIGETRTLMDAQQVNVSQTAHYFSCAQELRDWTVQHLPEPCEFLGRAAWINDPVVALQDTDQRG